VKLDQAADQLQRDRPFPTNVVLGHGILKFQNGKIVQEQIFVEHNCYIPSVNVVVSAIVFQIVPKVHVAVL
jgi:hypothetical protein